MFSAPPGSEGSNRLASAHPASNYAMDINVDSGVTNPIASAKEVIGELTNALWLLSEPDPTGGNLSEHAAVPGV